MKITIILVIVYIIIYVVFNTKNKNNESFFSEPEPSPVDERNLGNEEETPTGELSDAFLEQLQKERLDMLLQATEQNDQNKDIKKLRRTIDGLRNDLMILRKNKNMGYDKKFAQLESYDKINNINGAENKDLGKKYNIDLNMGDNKCN